MNISTTVRGTDKETRHAIFLHFSALSLNIPRGMMGRLSLNIPRGMMGRKRSTQSQQTHHFGTDS